MDVPLHLKLLRGRERFLGAKTEETWTFHNEPGGPFGGRYFECGHGFKIPDNDDMERHIDVVIIEHDRWKETQP